MEWGEQRLLLPAVRINEITYLRNGTRPPSQGAGKEEFKKARKYVARGLVLDMCSWYVPSPPSLLQLQGPRPDGGHTAAPPAYTHAPPHSPSPAGRPLQKGARTQSVCPVPPPTWSQTHFLSG